MGVRNLLAAEGKAVNLPKPSGGKEGSLQYALQHRKSSRSFAETPLSEQQLSDLLWAACGVNRPESGKRTAPSAWNKKEIDLYVITASGLFVYDPDAHSLNQVVTGDYRKIAGTQGYVKHAPVNIVYVSNYSKMKKMPDEEKAMLTAANAGFIGQNVYLFCAVNGLVTVMRDLIKREKLAEAMDLKADQKIVLAQSVGYPKK
ncbi:nitroreductase family protein [Maridesulfovibrio sp.]